MQKINRLTARTVATLNRSGRHADGAGLYLSVSNSDGITRRRWVLLFRWAGKTKEMGLGSATTTSLAAARTSAANARAEIKAGRNPINERHRLEQKKLVDPTFAEVAAAYHSAKSHEWRSSKLRRHWLSPLNRHARPLLLKRVREISTEDILEVLRPIWLEKPEMAARVRARIEVVIDASRARGHISPTEANPARWRAHLSHLLPKRKKLSRGHHAALAYQEAPEFIKNLRERYGMAALALEFLILTATRTSEVLGAMWTEIDLDSRTWTIPASRMKSNRPHRVPLSSRAVQILYLLTRVRKGDLVFPRSKDSWQLSNMAMTMCLRRMKINNVTVHGFRSTFRDWAGDTTEFPAELSEAALAHVAGDETERAYRRGDALERRRVLMDEWGKYLESGIALDIERKEKGDGQNNRPQA